MWTDRPDSMSLLKNIDRQGFAAIAATPQVENHNSFQHRILSMLEQLMRQSTAGKRPSGPLDETFLYTGEEDVEFPQLIGAALDEYMRVHSSHRNSTEYTNAITASFNELLTVTKLHGNLPLTHITKSAGRQWIEYQRTPKPSAARAVTIQQKLGHIRHFLQYAVSQDWISDNVFRDLKLPVGEVSASREQNPSPMLS